MARSAFARSVARRIAGAVFGGFAAAGLLSFQGPAAAAPQSLGLVATVQPVPMICDDDGCVAQLSSFCLQRERRSPDFHTPYRVAGGTGLWLHLTEADGGWRRVPAEGVAQLVSVRGNTGIEVNLSRADLAALGAVEISVEVGDLVTLVAEPVANDPDPLTAEERAFAAGPARRLAASIFDAPEELGDAINILDRAINSMTRLARLSERDHRDLWDRVAGVPLETAATGRTRAAAEVYSACLDDLRRRMVFGLRNCLEGRRDELLIRSNKQLWDALEAGS